MAPCVEVIAKGRGVWVVFLQGFLAHKTFNDVHYQLCRRS